MGPPSTDSPLPYGCGAELLGAIRYSRRPSMAALSLSTAEGAGYSRSDEKTQLGEVGDGKTDGATEEKTNRIFGERHQRLQANDGSANGAGDAQMNNGESQQRVGLVEHQAGNGTDEGDTRTDGPSPRRIEEVKAGLRRDFQVEVARQINGAEDE